MAENCEPSSDTSSTSITYTVNKSWNFTIEGYSLIKGLGPGRCVASATVSVGGYDWAVYFYPDGKNSNDLSMFVSVFIVLVSEATDLRAMFELKLLDQSGKEKHKIHSHFDRDLENSPYALKHKGSLWGYKHFFKRAELEGSDYLKNDSLIIHCTVGVVKNCVEAPKKYGIAVPLSSIGQDLNNFLESETGCDISFQVGGETFKAHKLILAARSPVFRSQFLGSIGDASVGKVEVEDIEPSIFKVMLQFIYSDRLPYLHEVTGSTSICSSAIMMQHLMAATDRYGLVRLKQLCEARLCEDVSADTVATTLSLAASLNAPQLKAMCLKYVAANLEAVMQSGGIKHLEESCPSLLSELLETIAPVDEKPNLIFGQKRSASTTFDARPDRRWRSPRIGGS